MTEVISELSRNGEMLFLLLGERVRVGERSWQSELFRLGKPSEREAERKVNRTPGIVAPGIEIVTVFEPGWPQEGFPAKTAAHRVKRFVERIVPDILGKTHAVEKKYQ